MKLVIDINENEYLGIKNYPDNITSYPVTIHLYKAVRNGIPLDKIRSKITELDGMYVIRDNAIYAEKIPKYERLWYVRLGEVIDILDILDKCQTESEESTDKRKIDITTAYDMLERVYMEVDDQ